jgi:acetyl esterase
MRLADGIQTFIDRCNRAMPPDFYTRPLTEQRALYLGLTREFPYELPSDVTITDDVVSHGRRRLPIRVYRPVAPVGRGFIVYIRGGGFVVGSLETHNTVVAELASRSGLVTIAPDFRLAPEHPFPTAIEDCYGALSGVVTQAPRLGIDPERIVLAGDSSGANMAVAVAMMARDRGGPTLRGQALISPVLDFTRWRRGGADAPLLTSGEMEYYTACYAPDPWQVTHPYVSPLVRGSFQGLPPAYLMGAELDSLLVDAETYARRLRENNIDVELVVEPGLVHSAVRARGLSPQVADAWARFCSRAARLACGQAEEVHHASK